MLAATDEYRRPIKSVSRSGITMPATFTPDHLRAGLRPLAEWQPLSTEGQAYQTFYGLDFPGRTLRKGLGRFAGREIKRSQPSAAPTGVVRPVWEGWETEVSLFAGKPRSYRGTHCQMGYSAGGLSFASISATFASRLSSRARVRA